MSSEELQNKLHAEIDKFKIIQKDYQKAVSQRQQLDGQLNENTTVMKELNILKSGAEVFKLIGPVLVKQELDEAKQNVSKRIGYIKGELKRIDNIIENLDKKHEVHREELNKLQNQFQQMQMKSAMKV